MSSERDTHFAGFAKLLLADLKHRDDEAFLAHESHDVYQQRAAQLIAQRAYDFANHVLHSIEQGELYTWDAYRQSPIQLMEEGGNPIPDMTAWPE